MELASCCADANSGKRFEPNKDGSIPWPGGDCPVPPRTIVRVWKRNRNVIGRASDFTWGRAIAGEHALFQIEDIIAYRVEPESI